MADSLSVGEYPKRHVIVTTYLNTLIQIFHTMESDKERERERVGGLGKEQIQNCSGFFFIQIVYIIINM